MDRQEFTPLRCIILKMNTRKSGPRVTLFSKMRQWVPSHKARKHVHRWKKKRERRARFVDENFRVLFDRSCLVFVYCLHIRTLNFYRPLGNRDALLHDTVVPCWSNPASTWIHPTCNRREPNDESTIEGKRQKTKKKRKKKRKIYIYN